MKEIVVSLLITVFGVCVCGMWISERALFNRQHLQLLSFIAGVKRFTKLKIVKLKEDCKIKNL